MTLATIEIDTRGLGEENSVYRSCSLYCHVITKLYAVFDVGDMERVHPLRQENSLPKMMPTFEDYSRIILNHNQAESLLSS